MTRQILTDEQFLADFRKYLSEGPGRIAPDICSIDQAISFASMMGETTGTPLPQLTIAKVKAFKRNLRKDPKLRGSLRLHRILFTYVRARAKIIALWK